MAMRVHEIMHHAVRVPGNFTVTEAARLMEKEGLDSVLVDHQHSVGICTERDILRKIVARGMDPVVTTVVEIMSYPLHSISWDDSVEEASDRMNELHVRRLVVMEKNAIIGVISASCIAKNVKYITARRLASQSWVEEAL